VLRLSVQVYDALRQHGEETYPQECCGVLLGRFLTENGLTEDGHAVNAVEDAVRAGNTRTDSAHNRYNIAPQELVKIQRMGRERGLEIVGFYHSHPDHPAQWSPTDFAEAHWIGCSYVITAVEQGAARQTNSFRLAGTREEDKAFEDERVEVTGQLEPGFEPEPIGGVLRNIEAKRAAAIDKAVLAFVGPRWMKIAMVIATVSKETSGDVAQAADSLQEIAIRIEALVSDGRLVAQGDTKNWRFSEVRRPAEVAQR
jgi:proteasome lid subunit RPN8/RPN11